MSSSFPPTAKAAASVFASPSASQDANQTTTEKEEKEKSPLTMPSQAPTPRTTRNSRGLRQSPAVRSSGRVSARRRPTATTPVRANLTRAPSTSPSSPLATPTPSARFTQPSDRLAQSAALAAIPEEKQQSAAVASPAAPAVARSTILPPPIHFSPPTHRVFTPPPKTSSPLEHPRVSAIKNTPAGSARKNASPKTPVRYPRYLTKFIDNTPSNSPAPAPESPGSETRLFRERRSQEGEERFARELWIAIRNDHYMRGCWCGPPNIYNSREEAEVAVGHLRFYVVGAENKALRVLQKKDDFRWHCSCGNNKYHPVYEELINSNGKRPAQDTEFDLIAQNRNSQGGKRCNSIDRVVSAPVEPAADDGQSQKQPEVPASAPSMWAQACGIFSRAVSTMGSPFVTFFDKLRDQLRGDAYETVDTRRKDGGNGAIVVKRLKRQAAAPQAGEQLPLNQDGFDDLVWTDDPRKRIGVETLQRLLNVFATQHESIKAGNLVGGSSIADIETHVQDGSHDLTTSIGVHVYREYKFGPVLADESDAERARKLLATLREYADRLAATMDLMQRIYDGDLVECLTKQHPTPPRRLTLGNVEFRKHAMDVGRFLGFLRSLASVRHIDTASLEALSQMMVDVNAVHKQEMLPSFVEVRRDPLEKMPGYFPEDRASAMEDVPAEELDIQPLYDFRFPDPGPSDWEEQIRPGEYKLVPKPKGILKPSKTWDRPASPRYVSTPARKRKLAFISPVAKFIPPAHIPSKVMTPHEADRIVQAKLKADVLRDKHSVRMFEASRTVPRPSDMLRPAEDQWDLETLERDDDEMGLSYHARKYDGFLHDLEDDLEKRAEEDKENRTKTRLKLTPRQRMVRIPLPPLPSTPDIRRRAARRFEDDTSSPAVSTPGTNPLMRARVKEEPPKSAEKRQAPRTLEEFFAEDDDDLEISATKFQQLQIDRQIREEFELGVRRNLEEKRRREEEEARREQQRRIEEERRRQEEERRRKEEERRREQAARRQKEAEEIAALTGLRPPSRPLITTLSSDWDNKVANAARANPTTELCKTLEGQPLTRRDFEEKLLPPTAWLNDNIIIGSILHIADYINRAKGATDQEPRCAAFTSFFWPRFLSHGPGGCGRLLRRAGVRKANLLSIDTILIPICAQSHWTLAVIRPGKRTVAHIDSMRAGGGDEKVKGQLLDLVRFILEDQFVEADWHATEYQAPRQTNGWDCGVFTITNAICMALGVNPRLAYTERELTLQRRRLAAMLLNEGFKGEFSLDGL